jgi:hypothetical protein
MGRLYRVPYTGTLTAAGGDSDLLSIQPADDKPCKLVGWILGQSSEFGDSQEEDIRITVRHMTAAVTIGSGGSAPTPVPCRPVTDNAAGFTARCNDTTVSTTNGTSTIMEELAWNERAVPWERFIPPDDGSGSEMRPRCSQTEVLIVRMESTLADDMTVEMTFFVLEEG